MYLYDHVMKMCSSILMLALTAVLCVTVPAVSDGAEGAESDNPVHAVRDAVLSYFRPSSGSVVDVAGERITISLDRGGEIRKGSRFSVFRTGAPFYHPSTGDLIGYTEDFTGRIEVKDSGAVEGQYLCAVVRGDIRTGDIVRVTSSRVNLAFFQEQGAVWELSESLYGTLKESQRFRIREAYTERYEPESLVELSRGLGAEAVLLLSTPVVEGTRALKVRLLWVEDAHVFAEIQEAAGTRMLDALSAEEALLDISNTGREPWGSYDIRDGGLIAVGDITGSGKKNLVVSDGTELTIYSLENMPLEIWSLKEPPHVKHLSIDIHDFNNNGRDEIFVTSLVHSGAKMSSFVIEYDPVEGYRRIYDGAPYFLRVMNKTLLMQKFTSFGLFTGPVYQGVWKEGVYAPGTPLKLPGGVNIYGFTHIDWRMQGDAYLMTFDDEGYLNMYRDGTAVWRSRDSYGEFDIQLKKRTGSLVDNTGDRDDDSPKAASARAFVRGRLFALNTSRGQELMVVRKIPLLSNVPGLGTAKAEIRSLWWDGDTMEEEVMMKEISGPVTDYQIDGGDMYLIAKKSIAGFIREAVSGDLHLGSRLYYYTFSRDEN